MAQAATIITAPASVIRPLVLIDFELVFDVWSLLCCCVRAAPSVQQAQKPFPTQQVYPTLFHKSILEAINEFTSTQGSQNQPIIQNEAQIIIESFKKYAPSVKPWIPMYQLMQQIHEQTNCIFLLRSCLEPELIALMPIFTKLEARMGQDCLKILTSEAESEESIQRAILILTSDQQFHKRVLSIQAEQQDLERADVRLVRPRKLAAYDGIADLINIRELVLPKMKQSQSTIEFAPLTSNKFINLNSLQSEISIVPEFADWDQHVAMNPPLMLEGTVVQGFGRGSRQLGVPTANVEMTDTNKTKTANLVPGVYAAHARLQREGKEPAEYLCAMSIGWNPVYDNSEKTIEAFLVHDFEGEEFYGSKLTLSVQSFIRAEALFADFDTLIQAIQCDIQSVVDKGTTFNNQSPSSFNQ